MNLLVKKIIIFRKTSESIILFYELCPTKAIAHPPTKKIRPHDTASVQIPWHVSPVELCSATLGELAAMRHRDSRVTLDIHCHRN